MLHCSNMSNIGIRAAYVKLFLCTATIILFYTQVIVYQQLKLVFPKICGRFDSLRETKFIALHKILAEPGSEFSQPVAAIHRGCE